MKLSFAHRADEPELMDDLAMGGDAMRQTLDQLTVVNRFLGGGMVWQGVKQLVSASPPPSAPMTLADLGCGGGENLRTMASCARQAEIPLQLVGFDANPHVIAYAQQKSEAFPEISYEVADVTGDLFAQRHFDVLTCSLFLHHFSTSQLTELIPRYSQMATCGLVISDLQRHWLPWALFNLVCRGLRASPMIRHDGLLSIRRSFIRPELQALLDLTGLPYDIRWRWAFRYLVVVHP
jgi:2-polyprenyl-3-methyl-5-hydroxy-6-metoxy-1,4-benzoquinol methylase